MADLTGGGWEPAGTTLDDLQKDKPGQAPDSPPESSGADWERVGSIQEDPAQGYLGAIGVDPERTAEVERISETIGMDKALVEKDLNKARDAANRPDFIRMKERHPYLARSMADPSFAAIAKDDLEALEKIGMAYRRMEDQGVSPSTVAEQPNPLATFFTQDLPNIGRTFGGRAVAGLRKGSAGVWSWYQEQAYQHIRGREKEFEDVTGKIDFEAPRELYNEAQMVLEQMNKELPVTTKGGEILAGAVDSIMQQVPALSASALTRRADIGLMILGTNTFGQTYADSRSRGISHDDAMANASVQGAIEVGTELIPFIKLGKMVRGGKFTRNAAEYLLAEFPGEAIATAVQEASDQAFDERDPDRRVDAALEYLTSEEHGQAQIDTFLQTLVQTTLMAGGARTLRFGADQLDRWMDPENHYQKDLTEAEAAERNEGMFRAIAGEPMNSKVAQRLPKKMRQYIQQVQADGGVDTIYVNPEALDALFQNEVDDALRELETKIPGITERIIEGRTLGAPIAIDSADFAAHIAPQYGEILWQDIKLEEGAMSINEARAWRDRQDEEFQAAVEREGLSADQLDALESSADQVFEDQVEQLVATGRFTEEQARSQATAVKAFFRTMAAREGLDPKELYDSYGLSISGQPPASGFATSRRDLETPQEGEVLDDPFSEEQQQRDAAAAAAEDIRNNARSSEKLTIDGFRKNATVSANTLAQSWIREGGFKSRDAEIALRKWAEGKPLTANQMVVIEAWMDSQERLEAGQEQTFDERTIAGSIEKAMAIDEDATTRVLESDMTEGETIAALEEILGEPVVQEQVDPLFQSEEQERRNRSLRNVRVADMTLEELQRALLTNELTGIPNRRAYMEATNFGQDAKPVQASIDADSLKWINDNMGHKSGDALLQAIADALDQEGGEFFHISGDEFVAQGESFEEMLEALKRVEETLKDVILTYTAPNGEVFTLEGLDITYGIASTLEEADELLAQEKERREAEGLRASRGEPPTKLVRETPAGRDPNRVSPSELSEPLFQNRGEVIVFSGDLPPSVEIFQKPDNLWFDFYVDGEFVGRWATPEEGISDLKSHPNYGEVFGEVVDPTDPLPLQTDDINLTGEESYDTAEEMAAHNAKAEILNVLWDNDFLNDDILYAIEGLDASQWAEYDIEHALEMVGDRRTIQEIYEEKLEMAEADLEEGLEHQLDSFEPSDDVVEWAVKGLGLTDDFREAGYILPDGRMLDLSGQRDGGPGGMRSLDHRQLPLPTSGISGTDLMIAFQTKAGAIRIDGNSGLVDMEVKPTSQQLEMIQDLLEFVGGGYVSLQDGSRRAEFEVQNFDKLPGVIRRFYRGEDIENDTLFQVSQRASSEFTEWAGGEDVDVVDPEDVNDYEFRAGKPTVLRVFHGTTNKFSVFDASIKGNLEGQFGAINYFTSSEYDAQQNYAGEGPDLTNRIEQMAEQLEFQLQDTAEDGIDALMEDFDLTEAQAQQVMDGNYEDIARDIARRDLAGEEEQVLELYVRVDNPFVIGENAEWIEFVDNESVMEQAIMRVAEEHDLDPSEVEENQEDYEDEIDEARWEIQEEEGHLLAEAIATVSSRYGIESSDLAAQVYDLGDEATPEDIEQLLRSSEDYIYAEDPETGRLISSQLIAEVIQEMGFDSIILRNAESRFSNMDMEHGTAHVHVFDSSNTNIKSATANTGTFSRANPDIFMQSSKTGPRGAFQVGQGQVDIYVLENANLSTYLHETGHLFQLVMGDLASRPDASEGIKRDWATLQKWLDSLDEEEVRKQYNSYLRKTNLFGGRDLDALNDVERASALQKVKQEYFARGFESYLLQGRSPSPELRSVFARFKSWLMAIYESLKSLDVKLSKQVTEVYDRMFATEEELAAAEYEMGFASLFSDATAAGMTEQEFQTYQEAIVAAREQAEAELSKEVMKQLVNERKEAFRERKREIREEVEERVNQEQVYVAKSVLQHGRLPGGEEVDQDLKVKISTQDLTDRGIAGEQRRAFAFMTTKDGGVDLDTAAELFGFTSGDQMLEAFIAAPPRAQAIREQTERQARDEYGDIMGNDVAMKEEAQDAVHSSKRASLLMTELKRLGTMAGIQEVAPEQIVKSAAERIIQEKRISEIRPDKYARAEAKAAREVLRHTAAGNFEEAFQAQQRRLLNYHLYRHARDARIAVDKHVRYMKRLSKPAAQKRIAKAKGDFLEQINAILRRFEFTSVSMNTIEDRKALVEFVRQMEEDGEDVAIDPRLFNEAQKINYKELTYEGLNGLVDSVKQLEHVATTKNRLLDLQEEKALEEAVDELVASAQEHGKKQRKKPLDPKMVSRWHRLSNTLKDFDASLLKAEQVFEWLDGGDINGPWSKYIWDAFSRAQNQENDLMDAYLEPLAKMVRELQKKRGAKLLDRVHIPEINETMTRQALLSIALNLGNDSNANKLIEGYGWSDDQVRAVVDKLNKDDWDFVQGVWDLIDGLWPEIVSLEEKVRGLKPEKVEPRPIPTKYGTYRGGYYPVVYDHSTIAGNKQLSNEQKTLFEQATTRATTPKGHLQTRIDDFAAPILLDLSIIPQHLNKVIHDLTHRVAVQNANKVLGSKPVRTAIQENLGEPYVGMLERWVKGVANDRAFFPEDGLGVWMKMLRRFRLNTSVVAMGFKATTLFAQFAGIPQTLDMVHPRYMAKGLARMTKNPMASTDWVFSLSREMKDRIFQRDREVRDGLRDLTGKTDVTSKVREFAFIGIGYADLYVAGASWIGAYEQKIDEGLDSDSAARFADRVVRLTQGSGTAKDLAQVQREGNEVMKLLTMFYSYFSALYNRMRDMGWKVGSEDSYRRTIARSFYLIIIPAIMGELLAGRGPDEDEDEDWMTWGLRTTLVYPFMSVPVVKDVVGSIESGFDYKFSPVVAAGEKIVRTVDSTGKAISEDGDWDKVAKNAFESSGYIFGLPTSQVSITGGYVYDLLTGEDSVDEPTDLMNFLFRRKDD